MTEKKIEPPITWPTIEYEHVRFREEWRDRKAIAYRWWDFFKWFPRAVTKREPYLVRDDEGDVVQILPVIDCKGRTAREVYESMMR